MSIDSGQMDHNLAKLCQVIVHGNTKQGSEICVELAGLHVQSHWQGIL
jgi:hypothetical protein